MERSESLFGLVWSLRYINRRELFNAESILVVIYEGLYFDLAQGQMNGAPNETESILVE